MFATPHRTKGGAPQLGAKGPQQPGPFGEWPDEDEDQDGEDDGQETNLSLEQACQRPADKETNSSLFPEPDS